ncbi:hypothetical protein CkaCkLH20_09586 [Colletotrichum karsti]|uniref:WSC domain-containing protein n=1 Tax=Colletotrichum karsti TaxID=1095194 RepID=A0A9P6LHD8_9PEZI|nr:uncharacterized protein CkaCkLH20_09586 [Colletotrichum karsti]KAF9873076.1 hypothetical protein CkaCkLH20_09586 [Colletotrichum karsti]
MSFLLSIILMASMVAAQANHVIHGFEYFGCVNASAANFVAFVGFPSAFTPEQCQSACMGFDQAAAFADGCRCGRNLENLAKVDESFCANPCNGNANFGFCGFNSATCSYANVYQACDEFPSAPTLPASNPPASYTLATDPAASPASPLITYSTVKLPTITRTLKLATRSTLVVHTVAAGGQSSSCTLDDDHTPAPSLPAISGVPTAPIVVVQTVYVHMPPKSSAGSQNCDNLQSDPTVAPQPPAETTLWPPQTASGSLQADPSVATQTPAESTLWPPQTVTKSLSSISLMPYGDPPVPVPVGSGLVPSNATITTSPDGPMFRTILPEDPAGTATEIVPAVVTTAQAHRINAGMAGVMAMAFVAVGI